MELLRTPQMEIDLERWRWFLELPSLCQQQKNRRREVNLEPCPSLLDLIPKIFWIVAKILLDTFLFGFKFKSIYENVPKNIWILNLSVKWGCLLPFQVLDPRHKWVNWKVQLGDFFWNGKSVLQIFTCSTLKPKIDVFGSTFSIAYIDFGTEKELWK